MRSKTNRSLYAQFFPCYEQVTGIITKNSDWFIALFAPVVIGRVVTLVLVFRQSFENLPVKEFSLLVNHKREAESVSAKHGFLWEQH